MALIMDVAPPAKALTPTKRRVSRSRLALGGALAIIFLAGLVFFWPNKTTDSPVPMQIRKAVSFPVYYPDQHKLPHGYSLDTSSFHLAQPGVVVYSVVTPDSQQLTYSEEEQPERSIIDKFISGYIPLHTEVKTSLGQATFGAYGTGKNLRTVVSLPIDKGPWLIITAPASSSHADLLRILQSLTK
jgi:hypothetical protein